MLNTLVPWKLSHVPLVGCAIFVLQLTAACSKSAFSEQELEGSVPLLTKTTLVQANGQPINVHLVNLINLDIANTNRRMRVLNAAGEAQRRTYLAQFKSWGQQGLTTAQVEPLMHLLGYQNAAEYRRLFSAPRYQEYQLLKQEDPSYFEKSFQEKIALRKTICAYNSLHGGPTVVAPAGAPIVATAK
ncbi:hypothetical protein [Hymenobacter crusticola]|nr:hypothetical protein [Hymenobacter crusticola]